VTDLGIQPCALDRSEHPLLDFFRRAALGLVPVQIALQRGRLVEAVALDISAGDKDRVRDVGQQLQVAGPDELAHLHDLGVSHLRRVEFLHRPAHASVLDERLDPAEAFVRAYEGCLHVAVEGFAEGVVAALIEEQVHPAVLLARLRPLRVPHRRRVAATRARPESNPRASAWQADQNRAAFALCPCKSARFHASTTRPHAPRFVGFRQGSVHQLSPRRGADRILGGGRRDVLVHYPALVLADEIKTVFVCCRAAWRLRRFACQQPRLRYPPLSNDRPSCGLRQMPEAARIAVVGRALCRFSLVVTPQRMIGRRRGCWERPHLTRHLGNANLN
jgi:hypothetical protein